MADKIENGTYGTGHDQKADLSHHEVLHDRDILGDGNISREDALHYGALTEEERMHEMKLKKKIDLMIMPLVMLVWENASTTHPQNEG